MWKLDKDVKNIKPDLNTDNYESLNDLLGINMPKAIDTNAFMPKIGLMIIPDVPKSVVTEKVEKVMVELEELPDDLHIVKREHIGITFWNLVRLLFNGTMRFDLDTTERLISNDKRVRMNTLITIRKGNYCRRG